ncbi:MAG TPA: TonB-dependent receptor, partial [Thermoanaerobaculia bacterium]|nr:TonB-dependent receptor [Thermoanaerobaculia bacterium]
MSGTRRHFPLPLIALLLTTLIAATAAAQTSTATVRGKVTNESGKPLAAEINAVSTASGFVKTVNAKSDGTYLLAGLTPGEYQIVVAAPGYEPRNETLTVQVGQTLDMNLRLSATAVLSESITVVGNQAVETKTSEIATNVTPQQIEALPQFDRNFLNFAQLAPGVAMSNNPERKVITAHGLDAEQTNVFIDGVSFKNDVIKGGLVGQDASRGNPFPQNAVQEFRVLTQNFSAQYDRASSAVITAVTKSGTNQFDGTGFAYIEPKGWTAKSPQNFQFSSASKNADYRRYQLGLSVGGPIIKDQLHYFGSYEGVDEHAITTVAPGAPPGTFPLDLSQYAGTFTSPFRSHLAFGKVSWQAITNQLLDFSGTFRKEKDIRGFGGQTAYEAGENIRNSVYDLTARHQWTFSNSLNQASLAWQKYRWNPISLNPDVVGRNYIGVVRIGGKDTTQDISQRRIELRDDFTSAGFSAGGQHTIQIGGNGDFMHYDVIKCLNCNPVLEFNQQHGFDIPFQGFYGIGSNPEVTSNNNEFGVYGQDNWIVNDHLNLNLGLRWDYETNMYQMDWVTPADVVQGLTGKVSSDYFSTGSNRSPYKGAIQPRLGFSYDLGANGRSVIFGGAGRYYDRLPYNVSLDEKYKIQFPRRQFLFSATGAPDENGNPTIKWDPIYYTLAGFNQLIAQGRGGAEVFLVNNDTEPPYTNHFNVGYRQTLGTWLASASYNIVRGYRGFTWVWGGGHCCLSAGPRYGATLISSSDKRYWDDAIYVTLDRPYTSQSAWGSRIVWTHSKAEQTGNDDFSLDYPTVAEFPKHIVPGTIRDRIIATGIF